MNDETPVARGGEGWPKMTAESLRQRTNLSRWAPKPGRLAPTRAELGTDRRYKTATTTLGANSTPVDSTTRPTRRGPRKPDGPRTPEQRRRARNHALVKKFGMTIEQWEIMAAQQGGRCAMCDCVPTKLVVDHDHETGAVRGLLCDHCNMTLGMFRDNADTADRLARQARGYLERHAALEVLPIFTQRKA